MRLLSDAASGDVIVLSPLLGAIAPGKIDSGKVAINWFVDDQRDADDGVLVVPATTTPVLVTLSTADTQAIHAALLRLDNFGPGIKKSLAGIELGAVDLDGDKRADVVATYGCSAWQDGTCQSKGQFFLARNGQRWSVIE